MLLEELVLPLRTDNALFKAGIAAAAAGVAALVAGMGLAIKATFKWADEMDSLQDIMGGTNKTAAALNFTLRKSGTNTDTLTKGMTILSKGLVDARGRLDVTGKSLKAWGINVFDTNGMLKDQTALIGDISEKYSTFATQQEKVNFLTETFGRSGAELIDFFDTLAAEGGIDSVTAKVERLGLAIDPNRYEQFNRNLEELKLIGLALAVSFTEKVMPILEKFLGFISDPKGIDVSKILNWADTTIAIYIKGLGDSINEWASGDGPEAFSESLISWIEGIGDEDRVKTKLEIAMGHLTTAIINAAGKIDWSGIWAATDTKLDEIFIAGDEKIKIGVNNVDTTFNEWALSLTQRHHTWANNLVDIYSSWAARVNLTVNTALETLKANITNKLTDIAKEFYNRAQGWVNQAIQGFQANKGRLLSEIGAIVTAINTILKKIITSFILTFGINNQTGTGGASANSNLGGNSGNPTGSIVTPGQIGGRGASGRAMIGGLNYLVGELGPELFTPNGSGRLTPNNQLGKQSSLEIDYDRLGSIIANQVVKAMNSA